MCRKSRRQPALTTRADRVLVRQAYRPPICIHLPRRCIRIRDLRWPLVQRIALRMRMPRYPAFSRLVFELRQRYRKVPPLAGRLRRSRRRLGVGLGHDASERAGVRRCKFRAQGRWSGDGRCGAVRQARFGRVILIGWREGAVWPCQVPVLERVEVLRMLRMLGVCPWRDFAELLFCCERLPEHL